MAAAVAVTVSMGVMKPLLSKLTKLLEEEYFKLKGIDKEIKFLRDELTTMTAALQMLGDAEELNLEMRNWRDKLRELAYDVEDFVDSFMARVEHFGVKGFEGFVPKLMELQARRMMANEMEELKKHTMEVSERHKRYNNFMLASDFNTSAVDPRLSALYVDIDKLVGIDNAKKHIIEQLSMETKGSSTYVISIYGCGGIGKTTLANQVYRSTKSQFRCSWFVSVSRNPNLRKILRNIAKGVGIIDTTEDDDVQQLIDKLREYLKDKMYLVVIDDVWDAEIWKLIRHALFNNKCHSRIIMTTRNLAVVSSCPSDGIYVYQMKALNIADSKKLLCQRAFGSEELCYPHLEKVCLDILEKCGGLPLAIITISSLLADQLAKEEWDRVLAVIGRALAKEPDAQNMTKILSLSYFDLPHHLRSCLLYLSIFPEDHEIDKQNLISKWIAEGFICEQAGRSKFEVGEVYFNDLINRSLIQAVGVQYGQAKACRVHDIILDFITCKAHEENFVTTLDDAEHGQISDYRARRISVNNRTGKKVTTWSGLILYHVRSLSVFGRHATEPPLLAFTALRVLDLADCRDMQDHHLVNIEKLYHLKYLRLASRLITYLPNKIGELQYLETLDIQGTGIKELPSTIAYLHRLARLYIDAHTTFPDGIIRQMQSLEVLEEFGVCSYKVGESLQEFSQLTKLRRLLVSWRFDWPDEFEETKSVNLQSYVGTLISSCNLRHLDIVLSHPEFPLFGSPNSWRPVAPSSHRSHYGTPVFHSLDSWCPVAPCILRKLHISFCLIWNVPNWIVSLGNLQELELHIYCIRPEDVDILGGMPSLSFLELTTWYGTNGMIIIHGNKRFRSLKYLSLHIKCCGTTLEFEAGSTPKLEHLRLRLPVHQMECLNGALGLGIHFLSALTSVNVNIGSSLVQTFGDPISGMNDAAKCVMSAIEAAVEMLPNRPVLTFSRYKSKCGLESLCQRLGNARH